MFTFSPVQNDDESLRKYESLFKECFPPSEKFSPKSLKWLYTDNPDGKVIGFDAFVGNELAAHYVCVPSTIRVQGKIVRAALSLNTATHPKFQGKGLFTKLAELTYQSALDQGCAAIYGVANANSTPGFVRKLGFQLVEKLDAKVGLGSLGANFEKISERAVFERVWSDEAITWRCSNPVNNVSHFKLENGFGFHAKAFGKLLPAYAELGDNRLNLNLVYQRPSQFRLYLGLYPTDCSRFRSYFDIPDRIRPSPLNMIFRSLGDSKLALEPGQVHFTFLDFDAY